MRQTKLGWVLASASGVLGLVACIEGESPVVGGEEGGGGSGEMAATGGGAAVPGTAVHSSNYYLATIRPELNDEDVLCMPRLLNVDTAGRATCTVSSVEFGADPSGGESSCDCGALGHAEVEPERRGTVLEHLRQQGACDGDGAPDCASACVCDVAQAEGSDWTDCEQNPSPAESATGWCYVSPQQGVGSPALVADCATTPEVRIRFLNDTVSESDALVLGCHGGAQLPLGGTSQHAALGEPCLPDDEYQHAFSSYGVNEVTIVLGTSECASNVCLVNHFQGRASCPYGQTEAQTASDPQCFLPGSDVAVTVPVEPQLLERRADGAAICSCRCDGPGDGPFCTCGEGMECAPLVEPIGLPGDEQLAGSYCIPAGTAFDPTRPPSAAAACSLHEMNCGDPHPY